MGAGARRGWELAQWAVAHAHDLKVEQVSFGGLGWRAAASDKGWQKLKKTCPILATWDDHDYGVNDGGGEYT